MSNASCYCVFPGQGSQSPGMGKAIYDHYPQTRDFFDQANEILSFSLTDIMFGEDQEKLTRTEFAQPALLTVSAAIVHLLHEHGLSDKIACVAGHSLGEYSALYAAGSINFADALRLVHLRGQAMQEAVPIGEGGMVSLMAMPIEEVEALVEEACEKDVLCVANDNAVGQVVCSGHQAAIERLMRLCKALGKKAIPLPVSAPFHSPLMQGAEETMRHALAQVVLKDANLPVVCNVSARAHQSAATLREHLIRQICGRVRWRESMLWIAEHYGVKEQVECGNRRVLTGLIKRICPDIVGTSLEQPTQIDKWLASGGHPVA